MMSTVESIKELLDPTTSSCEYMPSLNALQLVEQKLFRFNVSTSECLSTYDIIEESQKVFTSRDFKPQ